MKGRCRAIAALLTALFVFIASPCIAFAAGPEYDMPEDGATNVVNTEAELVQWLEGHTEGTVTLGDHIQLTDLVFFYGPVTINTGSYGLTFVNGFLAEGFLEEDEVVTPLQAEITITGEGVDCPVVDVHGMGWLFIGDWNNYLYTLNITATGRDGEGGTALRLSNAGSGTLSLFELEREEPGLIRSFGDGAVGVELVEDFSLIFFDIEVEGAGSAAVLAHRDANVSLSRLSATGDGAQAVCGAGEIVVDTCIAQPYPAEDNIEVFQAELRPYWMPVKQGAEKPPDPDDGEDWEDDGEGGDDWEDWEDPDDWEDWEDPDDWEDPGDWEEPDDWEEWPEDPNEWPEFVAFLNGGPVTRQLSPYVAWDAGALEAVSFDALGSTAVMGELVSAWLRMLLPGPPPTLIVAVRDPLVPCISAVNGTEGAQNLSFWTCDAWGQAQCLLWYSDDDGVTWRDCTDDPGIAWKKNYIILPEDMIGEGTLCVLEVPGYGFSNVARFAYEYGSYQAGGAGGDRIGTDRSFVDLSGDGPTPAETDASAQPGAPGDGDAGTSGGAGDGSGAGGSAGGNGGSASSAPRPQAGGQGTVHPAQPSGTDGAASASPQDGQTPAEGPTSIAADDPLAAGAVYPAAQPVLPRPGAGTTAAIAVASAVALAALGGWVWLGRLRAVKR